MTQAQLAERAGVSVRLVISLELGDATGIRLDKMLGILNAAGLEMTVAPDIHASEDARPGPAPTAPSPGAGTPLPNAPSHSSDPLAHYAALFEQVTGAPCHAASRPAGLEATHD